MGAMCGLGGKTQREHTGNMQQPLTNYSPSKTPRNHGVSISEHVNTDTDISDVERLRLYLEESWRIYWPVIVSQYSKKRAKFSCIQTLCKEIKIHKVENTERRVYDNNETKCESIYILFHLDFSISYRKQKFDFSASIQFDDTFWIFKDNQFDTNNMHWKQNLMLINENISALQKRHILKSIGFENNYSNNKIVNIIIEYLPSPTEQEIYVIKNGGKIDKNMCFLMQSLYSIDVNDNMLMYECLNLFWKWFTSKDVFKLKNEHIKINKSYQNIIDKKPNTNDLTTFVETNNDMVDYIFNTSQNNIYETISKTNPQSDDILNENYNKQVLSSKESNPVVGVVMDTMGRDVDDEEKQIQLETHNNQIGVETNVLIQSMSGVTRQFYNFLLQNGLEEYFDKFKEKNCSEIGYIYDLMDNECLENDIGIKNNVHRKRFIRESILLKNEMNEFRQCINSISPLLFEKLAKKYGIVTVNILCKEVENKSDLKNKFEVNDESHCNLLWNIIENQLHPPQIEYQFSTEGTQNSEPILNINEEEFPSRFNS